MQTLSLTGEVEQPIIKETLVWYSVEHTQPDKTGFYLCKCDNCKTLHLAWNGSYFYDPRYDDVVDIFTDVVKYWAEFPIGP